MDVLETLRDAGARTITSEHATGSLIPLDQDGVVFRHMFEYGVADFEAEVGFYSQAFGFSPVAITHDYALFTHPDGSFCVSFRKDTENRTVGLKLLFMTADIDAAEAHLAGTGLVEDREIRNGSPVQRVIYFAAPSGLAIEIWEDPAPG